MARDDVEAVFTGMDQLRGRLRHLAGEGQEKAGKFAGRKAANVLRDSIKQEVARVDDPLTTESIEENITARFSNRFFRKTGDLKYRVGVRGGAVSRERNESNPGGDTFYWRFLNFGTKYMPRMIAIERAAQGVESEVFNAFRVNFQKGIERAIKRARKARQ